jgi:hypothetical protein
MGHSRIRALAGPRFEVSWQSTKRQQMSVCSRQKLAFNKAWLLAGTRPMPTLSRQQISVSNLSSVSGHSASIVPTGTLLSVCYRLPNCAHHSVSRNSDAEIEPMDDVVIDMVGGHILLNKLLHATTWECANEFE